MAPARSSRSDIQRLQDQLGRWADSVFGRGRNPAPTIRHLEKEVRELLAAPFDVVEYADCLILLVDAARNAGFAADDLVEAAFRKHEVNRRRRWGRPDENGVVEHVRGV